MRAADLFHCPALFLFNLVVTGWAVTASTLSETLLAEILGAVNAVAVHMTLSSPRARCDLRGHGLAAFAFNEFIH